MTAFPSRCLFIALAVLFVSVPFAARAQSAAADAAAYQARLQADYDQATREREALVAERKKITDQKALIEQDIAIINAQIKEAQARVAVKTASIASLTKDIGVKAQSIQELEDRLLRSSESLANLLRRTYAQDDTSLPQILLGNDSFSEFFIELDAYQTLQSSLSVSMDDMKEFKVKTETEKEALQDRKDKETDARQVIEAEQREIERKKAERDQLLAVVKKQDTAYQTLIANKERRLAQIKSALFQLSGGEGIPFADAYAYAVEASKATAVRPAFLLAILQQESDIGKNVGNCYLKSDNGSGVSVSTGKYFKNVMKPDRDVKPFKAITSNLGFDPYAMRVSCPLSYGYGGAMGPAQFIPSTWKLFESRVTKALSISIANPWDPEHAFVASSLYLSDLGAGLQTYSAELNAACKYYSGARCGLRTGGTTYGNSVMKKAQNIQECMIDPIQGKSSGC
ncbi:MAG: hypothetical protein WC767_00665 [Candidatus Paceibacterota bacterium]|jgi:membrane-bound lytic murein transglycosylase B